MTSIRRPRRSLAIALVVVAVVFAAEPTWACAVCGAALEKNRTMFILTTVLLTFLPLGLMAAFGVWLHGRVKRMEAADDEARARAAALATASLPTPAK